jgi:hypothetical protein
MPPPRWLSDDGQSRRHENNKKGVQHKIASQSETATFVAVSLRFFRALFPQIFMSEEY